MFNELIASPSYLNLVLDEYQHHLEQACSAAIIRASRSPVSDIEDSIAFLDHALDALVTLFEAFPNDDVEATPNDDGVDFLEPVTPTPDPEFIPMTPEDERSIRGNTARKRGSSQRLAKAAP